MNDQRPSLAIELATGALPPALLDLLEKAGLQLLPKRWKDLKPTCSCPDWMNPCKHLVATYYLLANEIDKNPFILFHLKGMNTAELTGTAEKRSGESAVHRKTPVLNRFIEPFSRKTRRRISFRNRSYPACVILCPAYVIIYL